MLTEGLTVIESDGKLVIDGLYLKVLNVQRQSIMISLVLK